MVWTWRGVLALSYHRIGSGDDSPYDRNSWDATAEGLYEQLRFLKRHFDVVAPDDLAEAIRSRRGRYVVVTFDDGYRDNYETAYAVLKSVGVPATFFVTTGFLDARRPAWWDEIAWMVYTSSGRVLPEAEWFPAPLGLAAREREATARTLQEAHKALPPERSEEFLDFLADATGSGRHPGQAPELWMTWDMVRALRAGGMTIGGHTVSHPVLARLTRELQSREIADCKRRIETELGEPMRYLSYPYGLRWAFNDDTRACLSEHGIELAFSDYGGYRRYGDWDPGDVRRCTVGRTTTADRFRIRTALPQVFARW